MGRWRRQDSYCFPLERQSQSFQVHVLKSLLYSSKMDALPIFFLWQLYILHYFSVVLNILCNLEISWNRFVESDPRIGWWDSALYLRLKSHGFLYINPAGEKHKIMTEERRTGGEMVAPVTPRFFWKSLENHVDFHGMTGSWTLRKIWTYHSLKMSIELTTSSRIYYSYPFLHPFRYVSISADDLESPTATDWGAIEAAVLSELDARSLCSLEGDSDRGNR